MRHIHRPLDLLCCLAGIVFLTLPSQAYQKPDAEDTFKAVKPPALAPLPPLNKRAIPAAAAHSLPGGKLGTRTIQNGVVLDNGVLTSPRFALAGVGRQPSQTLLQKALSFETLSPKEKSLTLDGLATWRSEYYGEGMPASARQQLKDLYRQLSEGAVEASGKALSDSDQKKKLDATAALLTEVLLQERKIFAAFPAAEERRYGRRLRPLPAVLPDPAKLQAEALRFLSGAYIEDEKKATDFPRVGIAERMPSLRAGYFRLRTNSGKGSAPPPVRSGPCPIIGSWSTTRVIDGPYTSSVEGRAFVAEHPVSGQTWEQAGLPTLYHTSILAGIWSIELRTEETATTVCNTIGQQPTTNTKKKSILERKFHSWVLANGCSGTYRPGDELKEFFKVWKSGDAIEDVRKVLLGTSADSNGKTCRARFGAYPVGFYGANWVCHQACNAFTTVKWGVAPVFYVDTALYLVTGNLGIADTKDRCQCVDSSVNHCCIPGNGCCWASTYGAGDGWGFGIDSGYHPSRGWISTECKINNQAPAIQGWNELIAEW